MIVAIIILGALVGVQMAINFALLNRLLIQAQIPSMKPVQVLPKTIDKPEPLPKKPLSSVRIPV